MVWQRRGIITLIPKPNKDTTLLDYLRPTSLLNIDYKVLTKVIAKRLENFKKAFDTIEWDFINSCLKKLNFGLDIQNWFKVLYKNVNSCILNNGYASEFFSLERGVRQGCPLSGLLIVIGIEILARAIKNDAGIKGIKVGEKEIKVSLYADDTTVFVRDLDSITHLLSLLDKFKNLSGLEMNTKKTEGMWLGCWKNNTETPFGFHWPRDPTKALGIFFSYDLNKSNELNFVKKKSKFRKDTKLLEKTKSHTSRKNKHCLNVQNF